MARETRRNRQNEWLIQAIIIMGVVSAVLGLKVAQDSGPKLEGENDREKAA